MNPKTITKTVGLLLAAGSLFATFPANAKPCPSTKAAVTLSQAPSTAKQIGTIVEVAASNPNFKTLVSAVQAAGLAETLSGVGPFTVFAPTDKAFAALPKGTLEKLLKPENKTTLQQILTYHVVSGAVMSQDLKSGEVKTIEGSPVKVRVLRNGRVKVNNAKVSTADIKTSNGVIHVIDKVILPRGLKIK